MDGFQAYKYYTAIKLHFTTPNFDVFENKGRIKCSSIKYKSRNDCKLFEQLARGLDDKQFIQYVACNFMYGNPEVIYTPSASVANYKTFLKRKQSITHVFEKDLTTIKNVYLHENTNESYRTNPIQLLLADKICIETCCILNDNSNEIQFLKEDTGLMTLLNDVILRVEKSKGFVKYDKSKIEIIYKKFKEETQI